MLRTTRRALIAMSSCALLLSLTGCQPPPSRTFYVSPSGNDRASGTSTSSPWRTLDRVNDLDLQPGDQVYLRGGATFGGILYLDPGDGGTAADPVVIDSYGGGRATIAAGTGSAIYAWQVGGVIVRNLDARGSGRTSNTNNGIGFYNDLAGDVLLPAVHVTDVSVRGFRDFGISIGGGLGRSGYRDVRLERVVSSDNGKGGAATFALARNVHKNLYVGSSVFHHNTGRPDLAGNSGSGIVLGSVDGATVERSVAYDNGGSNSTAVSEGPVGIWAYDSNRVTIQDNESYANRTATNADGAGFNLDQYTTNSVMQRNYSHDNDGPGFHMAHRFPDAGHSGNVVRFNISQNDARKNNNAAFGIWGSVRNAEIYHNTVYLSPVAGSTPRGLRVFNKGRETSDVHNVHYRNNILFTTGSAVVLEVTADQLAGATDLRFEGNNYWAGGGATRLLWGSTSYSTLSAWRNATGQERRSGAAVGLSVDPRLVGPGGGRNSYRLQSSSPMADAGIGLSAIGLDTGPVDHFGGAYPRGARPDVGAHELR